MKKRKQKPFQDFLESIIVLVQWSANHHIKANYFSNGILYNFFLERSEEKGWLPKAKSLLCEKF